MLLKRDIPRLLLYSIDIYFFVSKFIFDDLNNYTYCLYDVMKVINSISVVTAVDHCTLVCPPKDHHPCYHFTMSKP